MIALALATVACGSMAPKAAKPTPPASASALPTANPSPTAAPSASSPSTPSYGILVAFADGTGPQSAGYDLALVAPDGKVAAKAHAAVRSFIHSPGNGPGGAAASDLPEVSTSSSRVYYLDGDGDVRSLRPDGSSAHVTQVPGTKTVHAAFSVTPDDRRIAVSLLDYALSPPAVRLYVEDLQGGGNHAEIFSSQKAWVWPIGWRQGKLVLAATSSPPFSQQGIAWNPYGAPEYHVVDATSATRLATIGSGQDPTGCQPTGPLSAGGSACYHRNATTGGAGYFSTLDWTGRVGSLRVTTDSGGAPAVTRSGDSLAGCCDPGGTAWIAIPGNRFQSQVRGSFEDWPCFIDEANILFGFLYPTANQHPQIVNARRNMDGMVPIQVPASGYCAGVLPAALD
ncbi:MAG TPA: hypothetical protein VJT14_14175 [Candidatus Dormibacteraeota bacterium]|nr:hypothetical protein [Candidatus Dormibacteraeota bacterium]